MSWQDATIGDLIKLNEATILQRERFRKAGTSQGCRCCGPQSFHNEFKAKGPGVVVGRSGGSYWQGYVCSHRFLAPQ